MGFRQAPQTALPGLVRLRLPAPCGPWAPRWRVTPSESRPPPETTPPPPDAGPPGRPILGPQPCGRTSVVATGVLRAGLGAHPEPDLSPSPPEGTLGAQPHPRPWVPTEHLHGPWPPCVDSKDGGAGNPRPKGTGVHTAVQAGPAASDLISVPTAPVTTGWREMVCGPGWVVGGPGTGSIQGGGLSSTAPTDGLGVVGLRQASRVGPTGHGAPPALCDVWPPVRTASFQSCARGSRRRRGSGGREEPGSI